MPEIEVLVNGRSYRLACEDGEEDRLVQLAEHIDTHAKALSKVAPRASDAQLLLMAGLMVGDELTDALDRVEELETNARQAKSEGAGVAAQALLDGAARRIEELAGRIRSA
jgi:cell division protein ZapA